MKALLISVVLSADPNQVSIYSLLIILHNRMNQWNQVGSQTLWVAIFVAIFFVLLWINFSICKMKREQIVKNVLCMGTGYQRSPCRIALPIIYMIPHYIYIQTSNDVIDILHVVNLRCLGYFPMPINDIK